MKVPLRNLLPLSREGVLWFFISSAMLITGLLKGINLITLLACWMVILVILNYWWAIPQLRCLTVRRLFPEAAFAETPFSFLLKVANGRKKASFGISIHDGGADHQVTRFLPKLEVGTSAPLSVTLEIPRRGRYQLAPLELTTGYPLALVHLAKSMSETEDLIVFPKLGQLHRGTLRQFLSQHSPSEGQARAFPRRHPGAQTEFHGLRPFRAGDSPRWIHWRTTARRGELMIREFEDMPNDHLVLIVDPGSSDSAFLERLLSMAATICWEWCRQKDNRLALAVVDAQATVLVGNTGYDCACAMLERLALTTPHSSQNVTAFLDALGSAALPPGPILVLSTADSGIAAAVAQYLHRSVATLNLGLGEDKDFFN